MSWRIESDGTLRGPGRTIPGAPGKSIRALVRAGVDEQGIAEVEHYVRDEGEGRAARRSQAARPGKRSKPKREAAGPAWAPAWLVRLGGR